MAVVLDKANVVLVDKDGNRATVTSLTDNDLNKLSVGLSDVSDLKTRVKTIEDNGYVSYNSVQTLDEEQCSQAQANMNAPGLSANNTFTGNMTVEANVKADSMTLNTRSDYAKLSASTNDHGIKLLGGSSATTGASIDLRGSTDTDAPNTFTVSASNGVALAGSKDGSLTWNSENVVRKVNNLPADASGNVLLGTEKSTFNKVVYDTGYFSIGANATYNFDLTGSDIENISKENVNIRIVAKVVTAHNGFQVGDIAQLTTNQDAHGQYGTLGVSTYIQGNTLYLRSGTREVFTIENASSDRWLEKANVQIKAILTAFVPDDGSILLIAEDQTNTSKLIGLPDGTLTWRDRNLVRSVNGVNADASGNVTITVGSEKADNDLSNVTAPTQAFKDMSIGWGMPDYDSAISISGVRITNSNFTVPTFGFVRVKFNMANGYETFYIDDEPVYGFLTSETNIIWTYLLPIDVGTHTMRTSSYPPRIESFEFIPCKGV